MFSIFHEFSVEIDAPLKEVWKFAQNPSNWIMWGSMYESCHIEGGQFKSGEVVKVHVKNRRRPSFLLLTEVDHERGYKTQTKTFGVSEENTYTLEAFTPYRTRFTSKLHFRCFIVPFLRSIVTKKIHERKSSALRAFARIVEEHRSAEKKIRSQVCIFQA
jgi:hypothetical protein